LSEPQRPEKLGRYIIVQEIGKGAMGIVYEGYDPNIDRRVAIKTARRDVLEASGRAEELMERFLREARAAGTLSHPNIVTIYDAGKEGDLAYIAMEYLEGGTLSDIIKAKERMAPDTVARTCAAICDALATAHAKGVVHRDVKPANIVVSNDGAIKVADFGIAHVSDSTLTQEGSMIGTPFYMSPEQFMGQHIDGRSDLFSVGIICYELLTGEKPFTGEALSTVMHSVLKVTPVAPHELNYNVKRCLSRVVMKALSKEPDRRYQDGHIMAAALRECTKADPDSSILNLSSDGLDDERTVLQHTAPAATVVADTRTTTATARTTLSAAIPVASPDLPADAATLSGSVAATTRRTASKARLFVAVGVLILALTGAGAFFQLRGTTSVTIPPSGPGPVAIEPSGSQGYTEAPSGPEELAETPSDMTASTPAVFRYTVAIAPNEEAYMMAKNENICRDCIAGPDTAFVTITAKDADGNLVREQGSPWLFMREGRSGEVAIPPTARTVIVRWDLIKRDEVGEVIELLDIKPGQIIERVLPLLSE
jgi:serine/threonine-protein kinase